MPAEMKYFCISDQTANYLQKYIVLRKRKLFVGLRTAADLFDVIKKHKGEKFLYPCSDIRKDDLPEFMRANNLKFTEAVIYRTVASDLSDLSDVKYDCLAFFSPSGISSLFVNFPDFVQGGTRIAAFGPTTAKAVRDAGLILDIEAPMPNAPSMTAVGTASAQQQPQFTHYGFNGMYLNPAYAGIKGQTEITLLGRYQYLNLSNTQGDANGSPRTGMASVSIPIRALNGGIGAVVYYDQIAESKATNSALSYSQHVNLGRGKLGIGIQGTFTYISKGIYNPIDRNDPYVPSNGSDQKFDAGAGLWYESPKFYAGLSANNLFRSTYTLQSARYDATGKITGYQNTSRTLGENHAYFTAGYNIEASSSVTITPTVLVKAVLPGRYDATSKY
nr:hypothetical protein [Tanacetum cinerariifolium]